MKVLSPLKHLVDMVRFSAFNVWQKASLTFHKAASRAELENTACLLVLAYACCSNLEQDKSLKVAAAVKMPEEEEGKVRR